MKTSLIYRTLNMELCRWQENVFIPKLSAYGFNANGASRMLACTFKEMRVWQPVP